VRAQGGPRASPLAYGQSPGHGAYPRLRVGVVAYRLPPLPCPCVRLVYDVLRFGPIAGYADQTVEESLVGRQGNGRGRAALDRARRLGAPRDRGHPVSRRDRPGAGLDALHGLSQPDEWDGSDRSEDVVEAAAAAYRLARLEPERGIARLTALTADPRFVAVQAAAAIHLLDEERGSDALVRLAEDAATELEFRLAAARLLQSYGHSDGDRLLAHVVDGGGEKARRKAEALTEQHAVVAAVRRLTEIEEETDEILASPRAALLHLVAEYPAESQRGAVLPDDPDEILLGPGVIDSGLTPYLNRLDLDQALDQRALAVAIPVYDAPLDRNYLVASALARAPHALELQRYLGAWSVGALEDSPIWIFSDDESRPEVGKWAEAVARAMAVFDIPGGVVIAIWGDLSKVIYRCLALAFRHPTPEVLLEIAHRAESPIYPMISVPLNGIRPMPGLAAPAVRACVGRTCLSTVVEALADVDTDTDAVRSAYADRIAGLACDHHT
jgi:hypothetical protein